MMSLLINEYFHGYDIVKRTEKVNKDVHIITNYFYRIEPVYLWFEVSY